MARQIQGQAHHARVEKRTLQVPAGAIKKRRPKRRAVRRLAEVPGRVQTVERIVRHLKAVEYGPACGGRLDQRGPPETCLNRGPIGKGGDAVDGMIEVTEIMQAVGQSACCRETVKPG